MITGTMSGRIYIGHLEVDAEVIAKLNQKHSITEEEARAYLQWPARVLAAFDNDPRHGPRWVALVYTSDGDALFAALDPVPPWEGEKADTWRLRTAYWLE